MDELVDFKEVLHFSTIYFQFQMTCLADQNGSSVTTKQDLLKNAYGEDSVIVRNKI